MKTNKKIILFISIFIIFLIIFNIIYSSLYKNKENMEGKPNIIGYIHICQKEGWKRSYDILIDYIKKYGLYENMKELRIGVVNDNGVLIPDERFNDNKIKIIYTGKSDEYERPTLLHMKKYSNIDEDKTLYFYLHTKGIRHFNTKLEESVLKWINDMLYWNIQLWEDAVDKLKTYETYGCNYNYLHYSGNFWWATKEHIQKLPDKISSDYIAPENWVLTNKDNLYCANNCGKNFVPPFKSNYLLSMPISQLLSQIIYLPYNVYTQIKNRIY
jgi:hypothetical protein